MLLVNILHIMWQRLSQSAHIQLLGQILKNAQLPETQTSRFLVQSTVWFTDELVFLLAKRIAITN